MEKDISFEKAYERLKDIVEKMSEASVPLDELMKLYEEGVQLASHCEGLLNSYEARLEKVSDRVLLREIEEDGDISND